MTRSQVLELHLGHLDLPGPPGGEVEGGQGGGVRQAHGGVAQLPAGNSTVPGKVTTFTWRKVLL